MRFPSAPPRSSPRAIEISEVPARPGVVPDDEADHDDAGHGAGSARRCRTGRRARRRSSSGSSRRSSPTSGIDEPGAMLAMTHAFDSWSRTTTATAIPMKTAQRAGPSGRPTGVPSGRRRRRASRGVRRVGLLQLLASLWSARSAHSLAVASDPAQGDPDRAGVELDLGGRDPVRRPAGHDRVGQRLGRDRRDVRPGRSPAAASTQTSIRSSSSSSASRRRSWIARCSSRASPSARSSGVSSVSMTTTSPSSWATAVPGRGVARISTSSGASVTPARVTRPVGADLDLARAGRGHDRRDRARRASCRSSAGAA